MEIKFYNDDSFETKCVSCGESILIFKNDSVHMNKEKAGLVCSKCEEIDSEMIDIVDMYKDVELDEELDEETRAQVKELFEFYNSQYYQCIGCGKELNLMRDDFTIDSHFKARCKECNQPK
jgi:DNA-directed RNA polymerase subunit RPC12/RpoP